MLASGLGRACSDSVPRTDHVRCTWRSPQRLLERDVDGVELVVAGHLLGELTAVFVLEDDEVADEVEEPPLVEDPFEHHLNSGMLAGASSSPSMVRQGMNHSRSAVSEPMRARARRR